MKNEIKRLLIGVVMAAVVGGATAAGQAAAQPVDGTQIATLDDLRAALPRDTQYYRETIRVDQSVVGSPQTGWSETQVYFAYDSNNYQLATFSESSQDLTLIENDAQGNILHWIRYQMGTVLQETFFEYDAQGRETRSEVRNMGTVRTISKRTYEPQPDGTTHSTMTSYDADGEVIEQDEHILDDKNRVIHSEISFKGYSAVVDYAYDDKDRLTHSVVERDGERRETKWQYTDSTDGLSCTYAQYQDGVLQSRIEQQFDENGMCVYQAEYTADGALASETIREPIT